MYLETTVATLDELQPWLDDARREGAHIDTTLKSPWTLLKAESTLLGRDLEYRVVILGWIGILHRSPRTVTIRGWYVKPGYRNLSIGTRLLEAAIDFAIASDIEQVNIRTNRVHPLERLGFDWTGYQRLGGNQEQHWVLSLPVTLPTV